MSDKNFWGEWVVFELSLRYTASSQLELTLTPSKRLGPRTTDSDLDNELLSFVSTYAHISLKLKLSCSACPCLFSLRWFRSANRNIWHGVGNVKGSQKGARRGLGKVALRTGTPDGTRTLRLCQPQTAASCCGSKNEAGFTELQPSDQHSNLVYTNQREWFRVCHFRKPAVSAFVSPRLPRSGSPWGGSRIRTPKDAIETSALLCGLVSLSCGTELS